MSRKHIDRVGRFVGNGASIITLTSDVASATSDIAANTAAIAAATSDIATNTAAIAGLGAGATQRKIVVASTTAIGGGANTINVVFNVTTSAGTIVAAVTPFSFALYQAQAARTSILANLAPSGVGSRVMVNTSGVATAGAPFIFATAASGIASIDVYAPFGATGERADGVVQIVSDGYTSDVIVSQPLHFIAGTFA